MKIIHYKRKNPGKIASSRILESNKIIRQLYIPGN
jgi:hypothetical protein